MTDKVKAAIAAREAARNQAPAKPAKGKKAAQTDPDVATETEATADSGEAATA